MVTNNEASGAAKHGHVENDLAQLKGIGPKYAELLKTIGVDSVKELRHRKPAHLKERRTTARQGRRGVGNECKTWIDGAKTYG